jgi:hypothetical protein
MYQFEKQTLGDFVIHKSRPLIGATHKKQFSEGVTPLNQATFNVYIAGSFLFSIGDFQQTLTAGQSTLDLTLEEFPANTLCTETCLENSASRYCISRATAGAWMRTKVTDSNWIAPADGLFIGADGSLELLVSGQQISKSPGIFCWVDQE